MKMRTIKLLIEYDGTNYMGWQVQAKGPTIQGMIEGKLKLLTGENVRLTGSGRTDAGVHAFEQVAHFRTTSHMDVRSIQKALNSLLPSDIAIKKVEESGESFHSRKQAKSKIYEYQIINQPVRSVFHRGYAWHIPQRLDWEKVRQATKKLVGEHDFSSFRSTGTPTKTTVRKIFRAEWKRGGRQPRNWSVNMTSHLFVPQEPLRRRLLGKYSVLNGKGEKMVWCGLRLKAVDF